MEQLTKKQKEILNILDEAYPNFVDDKVLREKLDYEDKDILAELKILEEYKFVELDFVCAQDSYIPKSSKITPKGKEKLRENLIIRLKDSVHKNPLPVLPIIVALLLLVTTIFLGLNNISLNSENIKLQSEKSNLEKPLVITPDARVSSNSIADLKFVVKNPSHSIDYYYVGGYCRPEIKGLFTQPPPNTNLQQKDLDGELSGSLLIQQKKEVGKLIPAGEEITLYCINNYVGNTNKDLITYLDVCVEIRNILEPICERMQVTVLKT